MVATVYRREKKKTSKLNSKQHKSYSSKNIRSLDHDDTLSDVTYTIKKHSQKI